MVVSAFPRKFVNSFTFHSPEKDGWEQALDSNGEGSVLKMHHCRPEWRKRTRFPASCRWKLLRHHTEYLLPFSSKNFISGVAQVNHIHLTLLCSIPSSPENVKLPGTPNWTPCSLSGGSTYSNLKFILPANKFRKVSSRPVTNIVSKLSPASLRSFGSQSSQGPAASSSVSFDCIVIESFPYLIKYQGGDYKRIKPQISDK